MRRRQQQEEEGVMEQGPQMEEALRLEITDHLAAVTPLYLGVSLYGQYPIYSILWTSLFAALR
jgi:hypothetical protein